MSRSCSLPYRTGRRGFTLIELLVVIAIIGTLVGLLLPAVQSAREAANRAKCSNNLKQVGLGINTFADANAGLLPNSWRPNTTGTTVRASWVTRTLPFMEQKPLFDKINPERNYSSSVATATYPIPNDVLMTTKIESLLCASAPSDRMDADDDAYATSDTKAVIAASGTAFTGTRNLYCAVTDYSATTYIDNRLGKGTGATSDVKADVSGTSVPTAYVSTPGDGMMPKDYSVGGTSKPKLSDVTDGLSNTIAVAECAGRPYMYVGGKRADTLTIGDDGPTAFPTRRINGGGWCRPASDFSIDGASVDGSVFGADGANRAVNATNGQDWTDTNKVRYGFEGSGETYGFHPGGAQVVFGDGSVKLISKDVTIRVYTALVTRAGAEVVDKKSAGL